MNNIKYFCFDCKRQLEDGEEYMPYTEGQYGKQEVLIKCKNCHKKDPLLRSFRETEVYSRVVGYIRPVEQWNKGKQEEFKDRVVFTNAKNKEKNKNK